MKTKGKGKKGRGKRVETEPVPAPMSEAERSFEQILQRERTTHPNSEGYHFIRPEWHSWVYGGGKKGERG